MCWAIFYHTFTIKNQKKTTQAAEAESNNVEKLE